MNNKSEKNNYLNNFVMVNKFNEKWNILFNFFIVYFKHYKYSDLLVNLIKNIQSNKNVFILFFIFVSWFWSNLLLSFICNFMLADSIIISLLILQNNSVNHNSRRLCKNIILIALANFVGGMITLLMIIFVYLEYSKLINRILFKIIKFIIKIIGYIFPPIYLLYPDIKLFNFDDPDNTIESKINSSCSSEIKIGSKHVKNINVKFVPINKNKKKNANTNTNANKNYIKLKKNKKHHNLSNTDNSDNSDNDSITSKSCQSSTFPTISKIDSKIINNKIKNIKQSKKINNNFIKNKKKYDKSDTYDDKELNILSKFGY